MSFSLRLGLGGLARDERRHVRHEQRVVHLEPKRERVSGVKVKIKAEAKKVRKKDEVQ